MSCADLARTMGMLLVAIAPLALPPEAPGQAAGQDKAGRLRPGPTRPSRRSTTTTTASSSGWTSDGWSSLAVSRDGRSRPRPRPLMSGCSGWRSPATSSATPRPLPAR